MTGAPTSAHRQSREATAALAEAYAYLRAIGRRAREQARPPDPPSPDDLGATTTIATVSETR